VTRNTFGRKHAKGESNRTFFTSDLQKLGKILFVEVRVFICFQFQFDTTNEKQGFSQTTVFSELFRYS